MVRTAKDIATIIAVKTGKEPEAIGRLRLHLSVYLLRPIALAAANDARLFFGLFTIFLNKADPDRWPRSVKDHLFRHRATT